MREDTRIRLMVAIMDRGRGWNAVELFSSFGLHLHYAMRGIGTANSELLNYLGFGETEKDVLFTLLPGYTAPKVFEAAKEKLHLAIPGRGILFSIPLSALSNAVAQNVSKEAYHPETEEEEKMAKSKKDLILVMAAVGSTDTVMDAAKKAGARGGTVLRGHRIRDDKEHPGDGTVHPEKEIIAILVPRELRQPVMEAVNKEAGLSTDCRGVLLSLPVDEVAGLTGF